MGSVNNQGVYEYDRTDSGIGPALFNLQSAALTALFGTQTPVTLVANTGARAAHATAFAAARGAISSANPCLVWRADATAGKQLEFTVDGANWNPTNDFDGDALKPFIQSGNVSLTTVSNSVVNTTVTFPVPFALPPIIQVSAGSVNPHSRAVGWSNVTTTSFRAHLHSATVVTMDVSWTATLPTS